MLEDTRSENKMNLKRIPSKPYDLLIDKALMVLILPGNMHLMEVTSLKVDHGLKSDIWILL